MFSKKSKSIINTKENWPYNNLLHKKPPKSNNFGGFNFLWEYL